MENFVEINFTVRNKINTVLSNLATRYCFLTHLNFVCYIFEEVNFYINSNFPLIYFLLTTTCFHQNRFKKYSIFLISLLNILFYLISSYKILILYWLPNGLGISFTDLGIELRRIFISFKTFLCLI